MKKLVKILNHENKQWVGDGFHVHPIIRPTPDIYELTNPFILMDYASAEYFTPTADKRGVSVHPHKGFETVTFAIQGEVEHKDSSGGGGIIKAGAVQWMTAGKGIVHEEYHSRDFAKNGGIFEMVQLWVNLPKIHKLTNPRYQGIQKEDFPLVEKNGYTIKVIAGSFKDTIGPAMTFSEINIFESIANKDSQIELDFKEGTNTVILVIDGKVKVEDKEIGKRNIMLFSKQGQNIKLDLSKDSRVLILNALPINEPIYAHGPFVMNTKDEIIEAIEEYNSGKMGTL